MFLTEVQNQKKRNILIKTIKNKRRLKEMHMLKTNVIILIIKRMKGPTSSKVSIEGQIFFSI